MLKLCPDRIGHGTYLRPEVGGDKHLVSTVKDNRIPLGELLTRVIF